MFWNTRVDEQWCFIHGKQKNGCDDGGKYEKMSFNLMYFKKLSHNDLFKNCKSLV